MKALVGMLREEGLHHFYAFKDGGWTTAISLVLRKPEFPHEPVPQKLNAQQAAFWLHERHSSRVLKQIAYSFSNRFQPNFVEVSLEHLGPEGEEKEFESPACIMLAAASAEDLNLISKLEAELLRNKVLRVGSLGESRKQTLNLILH